jgi:hypothetical protein
MAFRNVIFIGFFAPVLLAAYGWPMLSSRLAAVPQHIAAMVAGVTLGAVLLGGFWQGTLFRWA